MEDWWWDESKRADVMHQDCEEPGEKKYVHNGTNTLTWKAVQFDNGLVY